MRDKGEGWRDYMHSERERRSEVGTGGGATGAGGLQEEGESSTAEPADLSLLWASNAEGLKQQILAP